MDVQKLKDFSDKEQGLEGIGSERYKIKLGWNSSLPRTSSKVCVKSEEKLCDLGSAFVRCKAMKDGAPNVQFLCFHAVAKNSLSLLQDSSKTLSLTVKPAVLELLFCLCKWARSGLI